MHAYAQIAAAAAPDCSFIANPGGGIEDMKDLEGRSYAKLDAAFLYRTQYLSDCKCQPHPWQVEATDRHRMYALTAQAKGKEEGSVELERLAGTAKKRPAKRIRSRRTKRPSQRPMSSEPPKNPISEMSDW